MNEQPRRVFRWRDLVAVPLAVWLVTATFGALLAAWTVLTPAYQAPDEPNQVDRAIATAHGHVLIPPKSRHTGLGIIRSEQIAGIPTCCPPPRGVPYRLKAAPPADQRKSIAALGGGTQSPGTDYNQLTTHPPLYYLWEGAIAKALPSGWSYDKTLEGLRFASLLLVVPLPLLLYAATRRLAGGPGPVPVAASVLPLAIPMLTHLGASVTNDALLVLLGGLLTVLTAYVLTGDTSRRTAAWVGVVLAAAVLTKAFGFAGFFAVGAAYAVAWARALRARRRAADSGRGSAARAPAGRAPLAGVVIAGGVALVGGGWFWVHSRLAHGAFQPESGAFVPPRAPASWDPSPWAYFFHGYPDRLMTSFFGNFGWLADPLPGSLIAASVAVLFLGIALAFRRGPRSSPLRPRGGQTISDSPHTGGPGVRRWAWSWADVLVMIVPALVLFWMVGWQGWQGWHLRASIGADQGRYLYFGLAGLLVACALGLARLPRALRRWAPLMVLGVAAAYQVYAALDVLDFFWGPPGSDLGYQVHNAVAWSVWTGTQLAVLGGWAAVVLLVTILALSANHDRGGTGDGGRPATFERRRSGPDHVRGDRPAPPAPTGPGRHRR